MQINAYNNLWSSLRPERGNAGQADRNAASDQIHQAAELGRDFGRIIDRALAEPADGGAVQAARKALAEGTLETQDALQAAARNILQLGI